MKLLVFSPYYPPHIGGLESHAADFNKHMAAKNHALVVFAPRLPITATEEESEKNIKIIRFPAFEIIPNYPLPKFWSYTFWRLFLGLFKNKPDIVISRTRFFAISLLALIYAKIKRVRWVHIEHGSGFVELNSKFKCFVGRAYDHTFGRLVLRMCDVNIANSVASAQFCRKLSGKDDCKVIYRGVDMDLISSTEADNNLQTRYAERIKLGFVGRLIDGKGVQDLIQTVSKLQNKNVICLIVGDGPQKESLIKLVNKLDLNDQFIFFGHKNLREAISILKVCDIFVNPSYTEGLPTTVIEAALCKKAIIATNVGGTPEIFTDSKSGLLIEPKDMDSLQEKLNCLIKDKSMREQLGENAFLEVKNKFSWEKSIEKYLEIFTNLKLKN